MYDALFFSPKTHSIMSDLFWTLKVERAMHLASSDLGGSSDPYVEIALLTADKDPKTGKRCNIKAVYKTSTPQCPSTLNPIWNFTAFVLNADYVWKNFQGMKIVCKDYDTLSFADFLGGACVWFDDLEKPSKGIRQNISVTLAGRKGKGDTVSGHIILQSFFNFLLPPPVTTLSTPVPPQKDISDLISISSNGRKEVRLFVAGEETIFGELPPFSLDHRATLEDAPGLIRYGFDNRLALWLVTCCQLVYNGEDVVRAVCSKVWGMTGFKFINNKTSDTQAFVMHNEEFIVVCFRGTESPTDWLTNLNFFKVATTQFPERYLQSGVRVHQGFNDAIESIWGEVFSFVAEADKKHPNLNLFICGHSLGGALANLALGYFTFSDIPRKVDAVYTIGQPRAGNKSFREQLELASPDMPYIRITNNHDCVPSLARGQHCGVHVHFDAFGQLTFHQPVWKRIMQTAESIGQKAISLSYEAIADHFSPNYRKRIENHWIKCEMVQLAGDDKLYDLCHHIIYLIDLLQDEVKALRRYKSHFRALLIRILCVRSMVVIISDRLACGMDKAICDKYNEPLLRLFEELSTTQKFAITHQGKQSIITTSTTSEDALMLTFNKEIKQLADEFQATIDIIHALLSVPFEAKPISNPNISWAENHVDGKYDPKFYSGADFHAIDFGMFKPGKGSTTSTSASGEEDVHLSSIELKMLHELFDCADEDGNGLLSSKEFTTIIKTKGGIVTVLDNLGWTDILKKVSEEAPLIIAHQIKELYGDAIDMNHFISLMSGLIKASPTPNKGAPASNL